MSNSCALTHCSILFQHLEKAEKSHQSRVTELEQQIRALRQELADIVPRNQQVERDARRLEEDKTKLKVKLSMQALFFSVHLCFVLKTFLMIYLPT